MVAVLLASCAAEAVAQGRYVEIATRHGRGQLYHQAIVVPDGDKHVAVVSFRIPNRLLVFTQEKNGFEANVELTVELYQADRKVDEELWRSRHSASTFDETQSRTSDLEGRVRFEVDPGTYTYRFILNDDRGEDRAVARAFAVPVAGEPTQGSLIFAVLDRDSAGVRLDDANLGGDVPFGADIPAVIPVASLPGRSPEATVLSYQLYRLSPDRKELRKRPSSTRDGAQRPPDASLPERMEIHPGDELVRSGTVPAADLVYVGDLRSDDASVLGWSDPRASDADGTALAIIPLETGDLESGRYRLDVTHSSGGDSKQILFSTMWREMPLSLYDVEVAIRHLEFMEDRGTIRAMLRGSRSDQVEAFRSYWNPRDPTPGTIRNELMEEYYRRVDEAAVKFRTGQQPVPDGLRTDPAHIYVLYGEPEHVTNTLPSSGGVEETWHYADGRTFVFWSGSSLAPLELVD